MNKLSKKWLGFILCVSLVLGTVSCTLFQDMFSGKVVTTVENVKPEDKEIAVDVPTDFLTKELEERLAADGSKLVIVPKESVIDQDKAVPIETPNDGTVTGLVGLGLDIAKTVWPGVAALEGLGLLFSQRKRSHYATAIKAVTPYDGEIELKEAVLAVARGMGLAHSSEASKEAFKKAA